MSLKHCKVDILLITGMLSPYATVVEKLFRDLDKDKVTMLKIERAGDVLADTVGWTFVPGAHKMMDGLFYCSPPKWHNRFCCFAKDRAS